MLPNQEGPDAAGPARGGRRLAWITLIVGAALTATFLLGPRAGVGPEAPPVEVTGDVEAYLERSEARFDDLVPGTRKSVVWAGDPGARTPLAVVYIHGFSATHRETAPLSEIVADSLAANLFLTRLTGHGRTASAMGEASAEDWLRDGAEAVTVGKRLGDAVVLVGASTGGTLATWAATRSRLREDLAALVLISPNFGPRDRSARVLTWPWGGTIARVVVGPERSFETHGPLHARYWTESYPTRTLVHMMALVEMVTEEIDLGAVQAPVLVAYSPEDAVVDPARIDPALDAMGSPMKERIRVTDSQDPDQHVLAGEILSPSTTLRLARRIVRFVREATDTAPREDRPR